MLTHERGVSTRSGRRTFFGLSLPGAGTVTIAIGLLLLAGCRIVVQVPEGGQVVSDQGLVCAAGDTCVIDVADTSYLETFDAVANDGYQFSGWHKANSFLCGGSALSCFISTAVLENTKLERFLSHDFNLYLRPVFVTDEGRYDVAEWQSFLQTVGSSSYRSDNFLYQVIPDADNCDPGMLNPAATDRFLYALNLIRKLHRVPAVDYDAFYDSEMQQANLVQVTNGYFTHYPQQGDTCYTTAAASGAESSNLSWSSWQGDPARYALGWTNDNNNVSQLMAAGHRRWVLNPNLGYASYGQTGGNASMKVFGFGNPPGYELPDDLEYVAFPYQNYPYVMVEKGNSPTPWSLSMVPSSGSGAYQHFVSATLSVTEVATGKDLNVHSVYSDASGYGLRNFLSWMVDDWQYDTPYTVTISNVQMPDGSVRTIEYPVEIDYVEFQ